MVRGQRFFPIGYGYDENGVIESLQEQVFLIAITNSANNEYIYKLKLGIYKFKGSKKHLP